MQHYFVNFQNMNLAQPAALWSHYE